MYIYIAITLDFLNQVAMEKFIFILLPIIFFSCQKDPEINIIPNEVKHEVETFISEGKARGVDVKLNNLEIILLDSNSMDNSGEYYVRTHEIHLDTTSSAYRHNKEALIFHELGHGILNRGHRCDSLNGMSPASIMSTEMVIYTGKFLYRREYYINELFNPSTPKPNWVI